MQSTVTEDVAQEVGLGEGGRRSFEVGICETFTSTLSKKRHKILTVLLYRLFKLLYLVTEFGCAITMRDTVFA